jgi:hypothetical protein
LAAANNLGAKVNIKGSGSTSATTSLLVQNSAALIGGTVTSDGGFRSIAYYDSFQRHKLG